MHGINFSWYKAVDLQERATALKKNNPSNVLDESTLERARARLKVWREQSPFNNAEIFDERLAMSALTMDEFILLIGADEKQVQRFFDTAPDWVTKLTEISDLDRIESPDYTNTSLMQFCDMDPFMSIIQPFLLRAREALEGFLREPTEKKLIGTSLIEGLIRVNLPARLRWMCTQTLALEIFIARRECAVNNKELGYHTLRQELAKRYSSLLRLLLEKTDNWIAAHVEMMKRLRQDWDLLRQSFGLSEQEKVVEIEESNGDSHCHGRSVLVLTMATGIKIVYKPRPMSAGVNFQNLICWINDLGFVPPLRTLHILDRGDYGWVEYIQQRPCSSIEEIDKFYVRQGAYLAIFHALGGCDLHNENLIACGEQPVIVDLETVLSPLLPEVAGSNVASFFGSLMRATILPIGLVPLPRNDGQSFDGSGLGCQEGQMTPNKIPVIEGIGADEIRVERRQLSLPPQKNCPTLLGSSVRVSDYQNSVLVGFERAYRILMLNKNELLGSEGILASFSKDDVRVIIRPTQVYGVLLQESYHPQLLQNAIDRDRHFDYLWKARVNYPPVKNLISSESKALKRGDIPIWTACADSTTLRDGSGVKFPDFLRVSALDHAQGRILNLSEDDLLRNSSILFNALRVHELNLHGVAQKAEINSVYRDASFVTSDLFEEAILVGKHLERVAFRGLGSDGSEMASWCKVGSQEERWSLSLLSTDLYDGIGGIVLFLAYLGYVAAEERYTRLARAGLNVILEKSLLQRGKARPIGAFTGVSGEIYILCHLATLWNNSSLLEEAQRMVDDLDTLISSDDTLDIIGGVAGCIPCLLALYRLNAHERTLSTAVKCGEHLLSKACEAQGTGLTAQPVVPLAGFAHGIAGIAWALVKLYSATGSRKFLDVAITCLDHERSLFSESHKNWQDMRKIETYSRGEARAGSKFLWAWCHGSPGVGIGRLGMLRHVDNSFIREEAEIALESTLEVGLGLSHCLCHGDMGNMEVLLQAQRILKKPLLEGVIKQRTGQILQDLRSRGYLYGLVNGLESFGLMTGIAGIGYGFLRLACPDRVPAVQSLEGPLVT